MGFFKTDGTEILGSGAFGCVVNPYIQCMLNKRKEKKKFLKS